MQPDDCALRRSKDLDLVEVSIHQHLEHLHRLMKETQVADYSTTTESMRADLRADLCSNRLKLRNRRK